MLAMRASFLVLACSICPLNARRLHMASESEALAPVNAFSKLLLTLGNAEAGWRGSRSGHSSPGHSGNGITKRPELTRIRGGSDQPLDLEDEEDEDLMDLGKVETPIPPAFGGMPGMDLGSMDGVMTPEMEKMMADPEFQKQLKQMMSDPKFLQNAQQAMQQMREMLPPEALEQLEKLQSDPKFQQQAAQMAMQMNENMASEMQKMMQDPAVLEQLEEMMSDPDFKERAMQAAEQMKEMLPPEAQEQLQEMLNDPSFQEEAKKVAEKMKAAQKEAESKE